MAAAPAPVPDIAGVEVCDGDSVTSPAELEGDPAAAELDGGLPAGLGVEAAADAETDEDSTEAAGDRAAPVDDEQADSASAATASTAAATPRRRRPRTGDAGRPAEPPGGMDGSVNEC
jgi:hypothetical protein